MTDSVWHELFDSYAPQSMNEVCTVDSVREVEFLVDVLGLPAGSWGRRPVDLDEWEIMVVTRKPAA